MSQTSLDENIITLLLYYDQDFSPNDIIIVDLKFQISWEIILATFKSDSFPLDLDPIFLPPKISNNLISYKNGKMFDFSIWEETFSLGVESSNIRFHRKNYICVVTPVYWFPNNSYNTLSSVYMKLLSWFKIIIVKPLEYDFLLGIIERSPPVKPLWKM